ncbi:cellulase family glycosylhydrolase [Microbulbifer sp. 2205BS26-8]|uniref:cellulase family glycosylhydrolase n=1 Tax=Microbulbifer sp. 2205BS26-8 TaxID=3064386 RepID=UPI00273E284C|nr:cellulase family glycosylhydrolase [Microbulbifer sp. 2205BS26-8]MDP5209306.1 carbohydrate-binding protein [Microbulbifer sp. 2205BS26-8]
MALLAGWWLLHSTGVFAVEPLSVSGNRILIDGQPGSLAGNSYFWSNNGWGGEKYYNASTVSWLKSDWKSTLVRAAMGVEDGGGYFEDPAGNEAKVRVVVDAAIANDMYVIIDWHSHYAHTHDWSQAINFFKRMASDYGHTNNVIYEIYNEPKQVSWSSDVKPYAESVISAIRAIDPDNLIIVGTPTWSQDVDQASYDPIRGYANIAYTLHFYAGTHGQYLRDKAQTALNNGIALFATEWGTVNADGNGGVNHGETDRWMDFLKSNNISHANWSINDKNEGASALWPGANANGGWPDSSLTESGNKVRQIIRSWVGNTPPNPSDCDTVTLPARIEAEHFCEMSGVQIESTSDTGGGSNVGYLDTGDWMSYKITVPSRGDYTVSYRVAALGSGGVLQLEKRGGSPVYSQLDIPNTGDWQSWTTIQQTVQLDAGEQEIAIAVLGPAWNLNWLDIQSSDNNPDPPDEGIVIEAENHTYMSGVQTESTSDVGGGQNVGWIDAGDWMAYHDIDIPSSGNYTVEFRVAALDGGALSFERAGGNPVYGTLAIPDTDGWQNWTTISMTVYLEAGRQNFGIGVPRGGWNLNWIRFTRL